MLDFLDFDASGNTRRAVGNFEIDITLPSYIFVNDFSYDGSDEFKSVVGAVALIDSQKISHVPTDFTENGKSIKPLIFAPSQATDLLK